jgi:hypothetical protein
MPTTHRAPWNIIGAVEALLQPFIPRLDQKAFRRALHESTGYPRDGPISVRNPPDAEGRKTPLHKDVRRCPDTLRSNRRNRDDQ